MQVKTIGDLRSFMLLITRLVLYLEEPQVIDIANFRQKF